MQWSKIVGKIVFWIATELLLNLVGLDNLADYSEFIDGERVLRPEALQIVELAAPFQPLLSNFGSAFSNEPTISAFAGSAWLA